MRQYHHFEKIFHEDHLYEDNFEADENTDGLEYLEHDKMETKAHKKHRHARRSIDDYMEQKRTKESQRDPFEDFFDET